jgi:hypothetical protein
MGSFWSYVKQKGAAMRLRLFCKWQAFRDKMRHKRRVVILDTDTFKERISFELSGTHLITIVGISSIVLITFTTIIIAFTPLRSIIPGYVNPAMVEQTYRNSQTIDSLLSVLDAQEQMIAKIQDIVEGKDMSTFDQNTTDTVDDADIAYTHSSADRELRKEIEHRSSKTKK